MTYGLGYRKDPAHRRVQKAVRAHLLGATPSLPASASLESCEPAPLDQGDTSSCTGHGTAAGLYTALRALGQPLPWVPSPRGIYALTRQWERGATNVAGRTLPPLQDSGAVPSDVMTILQRWGVRGIQAPTSDGRNSDVEAANVNEEEPFIGVEADALSLFTGEFRIYETDADFVQQMQACLAGAGSGQGGIGCPVGMGAFVDSAVMAWAKGMAPLASVNLADPHGGGHWFLPTSYRVQGPVTVFRALNSWSKDYGDAGHFEFTDAWLRQQVAAGLDIYPLHVSKVAPAAGRRSA